MGPRVGLDRCGKSRPLPGFDARTVQPVASRSTDYATRPFDDIVCCDNNSGGWSPASHRGDPCEDLC